VYEAQSKCEQQRKCGPRGMPHSCTNLDTLWLNDVKLTYPFLVLSSPEPLISHNLDITIIKWLQCKDGYQQALP